jgi:hypothetical protein
MPRLAQLEQQRDKAEAAKLAAAERQATLERQIEALKKEERTKRERTIGKLAVEAGLGEWRDEALLTAFRRLAEDPTTNTLSSPLAEDESVRDDSVP